MDKECGVAAKTQGFLDLKACKLALCSAKNPLVEGQTSLESVTGEARPTLTPTKPQPVIFTLLQL